MQKIAFIRALVSNTEILLLDEATANLDSISKITIFNLLKSKNSIIYNFLMSNVITKLLSSS